MTEACHVKVPGGMDKLVCPWGPHGPASCEETRTNKFVRATRYKARMLKAHFTLLQGRASLTPYSGPPRGRGVVSGTHPSAAFHTFRDYRVDCRARPASLAMTDKAWLCHCTAKAQHLVFLASIFGCGHGPRWEELQRRSHLDPIVSRLAKRRTRGYAA